VWFGSRMYTKGLCVQDVAQLVDGATFRRWGLKVT
jgi:hypothetical protein